MQTNRAKARFAVMAEFERRLRSYERVQLAAIARERFGWTSEEEYRKSERSFRLVDRTPRVIR